MASVTVVTFNGEKQWKFAYPLDESGDTSFDAQVEAPQASRQNEWLQFLLRTPPACFVLNCDDGDTEFSREDTSFGFTHSTFGEPITANVTVFTKMTPELLEQLRQLPFLVDTADSP